MNGFKLEIPDIGISELIKNPDNLEDENFCTNLYILAQEYVNLEKSTKISLELNSLMSKRKNETLFIQDIISSYQKKGNNKQLEKYSKLLQTVSVELKYRKTKYSPELYIPNYQIADFTLTPIVAIGTDVAYKETDDLIPGWFINKKGETIELLLDEKAATEIKNPVLIFTANTQLNDDLYKNKKVKSTNGIKGEAKITQYKITERHERDKNSEYCYEYVFVQKNGGISDGGYKIDIRKIHKNDIGKLYTNQNGYVPNVGIGYWIVTFEHDWYTSKKPVAVTGGPQNWVVSCRMKYSNEWYQRFYLDAQYDTDITTYNKGLISVEF